MAEWQDGMSLRSMSIHFTPGVDASTHVKPMPSPTCM